MRAQVDYTYPICCDGAFESEALVALARYRRLDGRVRYLELIVLGGFGAGKGNRLGWNTFSGNDSRGLNHLLLPRNRLEELEGWL